MRRPLPLGFVAALLLLLALGLLGCPGDLDPPPAGQDAAADTGNGGGDIWPAQPESGPLPDSLPPDSNGYGGGAYGCQDDRDCFGMLCCPTPWGVRLCATTCHYGR